MTLSEPWLYALLLVESLGFAYESWQGEDDDGGGKGDEGVVVGAGVFGFA